MYDKDRPRQTISYIQIPLHLTHTINYIKLIKLFITKIKVKVVLRMFDLSVIPK